MIDKRIQRSVRYTLNQWTVEFDGDIPVKFSDPLAYGLFASTISSMCKRYYTIGKKEQKRKHKQRAIRRYHKDLKSKI